MRQEPSPDGSDACQARAARNELRRPNIYRGLVGTIREAYMSNKVQHCNVKLTKDKLTEEIAAVPALSRVDMLVVEAICADESFAADLRRCTTCFDRVVVIVQKTDDRFTTDAQTVEHVAMEALGVSSTVVDATEALTEGAKFVVLSGVAAGDVAGIISDAQGGGDHDVLYVGTDTAALETAAVGMAYGPFGSEKEKGEASSMILLDDSLASVVRAVETARMPGPGLLPTGLAVAVLCLTCGTVNCCKPVEIHLPWAA